MSWPDYAGNNFFNTLGNIEANFASGLLVSDLERGRDLHITESAAIRWSIVAREGLAGAEPVMAFKSSEVSSLSNVISGRWTLLEKSPFLCRLKD